MTKTAALKARLAATHDERVVAAQARVAAQQAAQHEARVAAAMEREAREIAARQADIQRHYLDHGDNGLTARSLANSARRIVGVLNTPCPSCGTAAGAYCFSGTRGFHSSRWVRSMELDDGFGLGGQP